MDLDNICKFEDDPNEDDKSLSKVEEATVPSVSPGSNQRRAIGKGTKQGKVRYKTKRQTCDLPKQEGEAYSRAQAYLEDRKILKLFNFLIGHLLVEQPPDPIQYLEKILKECVWYRANVKDAPLLFKTRHIRSMFESLGPDNCDTISLDKYKIGMGTLGICPCNSSPYECMPGRVDWPTFKKDAKRYLDEAFDDMIGNTKTGVA